MIMYSKCLLYYFSIKSKTFDFFTTHRASEHSCMQIFDIAFLFYLFSIFTSILNTIFLTRTKPTTTLTTDIYCISHAVPILLIHSDII